MPQPSLPPEAGVLLASIQSDIQRAWDQIKAEEVSLLRRWPGDTKPVRLQRLREMQANVRDLLTRVESAIKNQAPNISVMAYELGAWGASLQTGAAAAFTALDINAISVLARDTMGDLLGATKGVSDSTKVLIREMTRDRVLNATYAGLTAQQAGVQLAADLAEHSITSVVYANGARVALPSYTDMVLRTKTAIAYQEGGFQQGRELGIQWWEIMDGPTCGLTYHDDPTLADGMIVPVDLAERYPISHPACVRVTSPRPDINSESQARDARRTSSDEQVADQAAASMARAEAYATRPRRVNLQSQVDRELALRSGDVALPRTLSAAEQSQAKRLTTANAPSTTSAAARRNAQKVAASTARTETAEDVARRLVAEATAAEPALTALTSDLAQKYGGDLAGLDFRIKGEESLTRKILGDVTEKGITPNESVTGLFDINRYTMVLSEENYASSTQRVLDDLRRDGSTLNVKNYWNSTTNPYQGVNVQVTQATGERFELQFHTPISLEVKEGQMHHIYELSRVETDAAKIAEYTAQSFEVSAKIPIPSNISGVG